jgi:hypothetical protein
MLEMRKVTTVLKTKTIPKPQLKNKKQGPGIAFFKAIYVLIGHHFFLIMVIQLIKTGNCQNKLRADYVHLQHEKNNPIYSFTALLHFIFFPGQEVIKRSISLRGKLQ